MAEMTLGKTWLTSFQFGLQGTRFDWLLSIVKSRAVKLMAWCWAVFIGPNVIWVAGVCTFMNK